MKKRIISLLMSLVLIFGCCSYAATSYANDLIDSTLTLDTTSSTAEKLVFTGTDSVPNGTTKRYKAGDEAEEGIFINATKNADLNLRKRNGSWNIELSEAAVTDTTVTVKGTFTYSTTSVRFATITVKYNGSAWEVIDNPAEGGTEYSGTPVFREGNGASGFYVTCEDGIAAPGWNKFFHDLDGAENGIFVNGAKVEDINAHMQKTEGNVWYVSLGNGSEGLKANDEVTIKGKFELENVGTTVTFNAATFVYDGAQFKEKTEEYSGTPVFREGNGASGFYVTCEDGIAAPGWNNFFHDLDGAENGIFVNGTKVEDINAHMQKTEGNIWYVSLGNGSDGLKADDKVTIKGKFELENVGTTVTFNAATFVYDGAQFKEKTEEYSGTPVFREGNGASGFYVTCEDGIAAPGWNNFFHDLDGAENGIFVNGTKVEDINANMQKTEGNIWYVSLGNGSDGLKADDEVTVKGKFELENVGTTVNFNAATFVYDGAQFKEKTEEYSGTPVFREGNGASGFYVTCEDGIAAPGWNNFFHDLDGAENGIFVNGTKVEDINANMQKTEGNIWYVSLGNGSEGLKADDEVTIKGKFELENVGTTVNFNAATFVYDGAQFKEKSEVYNGTPVFSHDDGSASGFYVTCEDGIAAPGWNNFFHDLDGAENGIFVNGTKVEDINANMQKTEGNIWYVSLGNGSEGLKADDEVTVKGKFELENVGTIVNFNAKTFIWDGSVWGEKGQEIEADEENIVFTLNRAEEAGGTEKGIRLTATDNVPYDTTWLTNTITLSGKDNGVFLNGVKTDVFLKKYDTDKYYVCLDDVNVVPVEGDRVTIKGAFKTGNYVSSYQEYSVTYKDGFWVDGTEPETQYTTVTVTDYDTNVSKYNEALDRWEFYFATKEKLPGVADQRFETVLAEINGEKYRIPCYHGSHRDNLFLIIEADKLPKIVGDEEITVTISGKAKSADQLLGMDVQKFTLYMNKYGQSLTGFPEAIKVKEKNVKLTLDNTTFGWPAGSEAGIWLFTEDNFAVDKTWATPIRAISYDDNSGIFLNGKKIDGYLKKHADGMIYLDINAAGIFAEDMDAVTIKGTFALDGYGVSYAEHTFYWNGQKWDTTYSAPIPKTLTKLSPIEVTKPSSFNPERKAWDIYVKVDGAIPGGHDYEYKTLIYEVNGKSYETSVYRVEDKLVFFVPETVVPKDAADGTAITLKAGTASDNYGIYDIELTKDCTAYVYRKAISGIKPTDNTPFMSVTIPGLIRTWSFNEEIKEWQLFFIVEEKFDVEDGTQYYDLPVKLNGKSYEEINVFRSGECLYISIPESVLPRNTKSASLTIAKGAKAVANAGWNGIRLNNEVKAYMFDGVWNNIEFTEHQDTDLTMKHMNFCSYNADAKRWDIYVNVDKEIPGTPWFEYFEGLTAYLNGKEFTTYANKAESENNRLLYISLDEATFGKFKDGDVIHIPAETIYSCGGYRLHNVKDFYLQYVNGIWMEYYESDVKAPEAMNSLWEKFRINGYIPVQEEQGIMFTNVEPTNVMKSVEDMKDVTFTFETTKMLAMNEELPTNSLVLRGQPLNEEMGISETALYGYNISFSYIELTESNTPNNPELWGTHSQEIAVWKNGINYQLLDQYRMSYNWQKTNHPFFEYNEKYKYTVSIYNVEEDVCVIEVYCNDELVMRVVDHASSDPLDPARNAGEFRIYASCPQYFYAPEVELDTLEASATECYLGEQVRVSATYPAVLEGAEYSLEDESEGVTLKDGVFSATKVGTYTVRGSYNGEDKGTIQIKVTEKPQKDNLVEETSTFPIIPVAVGGGAALILAAVLVIVFLKKKKNTLAE